MARGSHTVQVNKERNRRYIHTSALGAVMAPGQVKVTNSWQRLCTTKLHTKRNTYQLYTYLLKETVSKYHSLISKMVEHFINIPFVRGYRGLLKDE